MSQKKAKPPSSSRSTLRLDSPILTGPPPAKKQKVKPLTSIAKLPVFDLTGSQPPQLLQSANDTKDKGKGKEGQKVSNVSRTLVDHDDRMWVDRYEPTTEEDLVVHKRKVQDVRQWLLEAFNGGPSGKLTKYRRILALTGPAGTAKTTTIRVLARELGFEILEWRNSMDERFARDDEPGVDGEEPMQYESLADKFRTFLARASSCNTIFTGAAPSGSTAPLSSSSQASQSSHSSKPATQIHDQPRFSTPTAASTVKSQARRQIILLEDLPNILHPGTQAAFQAALEGFATVPVPGAPLVIIISDTGLRGEDGGDDTGTWRTRKEAVDVRSVLPPALLSSPYVTQIGFNPIAPTLLRRALQNLVNMHFSSASGTPPSKEILNVIVESSNGDIRSAIMALQFACVAKASPVSRPNKAGKRRKGGGGPEARVILEAVTRREQSLALFHLLGKVFYNKRKGDMPNASASAKDIQRDQEFDARLKDSPPLPPHLKEHDRRTSRVDVDTLYADSPIDASLLSLYIHQNYTQYCNELDECSAEAEWLSWIDSSGGESWHQANPHRFHLLTLGTLHSLPSPVVRRNQKPYKPDFFDALRSEREAEDGVRDVQAWLQCNVEWRAGGWNRRDIALELGAVLKARELTGGNSAAAPTTHKLFTRLEFMKATTVPVQLPEDGDGEQEPELLDDEQGFGGVGYGGNEEGLGGGWLEGDDIEEF
ncbi:hypothetical protein AcV7_007186 [Taiwanofungus camphoratus]|nr:hypothetical protein AcV7_007186 [Antrodia cinnamomea]